VFWTFVVGAAALAALPFVTDGFYSKDLIIATSLGSVDGSVWLYLGAIVGAFLTALYSFRLVWVVFFGEKRTAVTRRPRWRQLLPLYVLGALSIVGGLVWMPGWLGGFHPLETFLGESLPATELVEGSFAETAWAALITIGVVLAGIGVSYLFWMSWRDLSEARAARPQDGAFERYLRGGWGFDWLYEYAFVVPVKWFAHWARHDLIEPAVAGIAWLNVAAWRALSASQTGLLRLYIGVAGVGLVVILAFVVLR
jgi:NADH-quinone oxidoreductase subunit L